MVIWGIGDLPAGRLRHSFSVGAHAGLEMKAIRILMDSVRSPYPPWLNYGLENVECGIPDAELLILNKHSPGILYDHGHRCGRCRAGS